MIRKQRELENRRKTTKCPLCDSRTLESFFQDQNRTYIRCSDCRLVFVPEQYWPTLSEEKATYDLHENDPQDQGYRAFLSRLTIPLLQKLGSRQFGLDFGCGPGPALSGMLQDHGHQVDLYDPFYFNDHAVFQKQYDFICATEVVEHLREPKKIFSALFAMLKPGGWLGIMTKLVSDKDAFSKWHYIRDRTHICFYSKSTFQVIANRFNARLEISGNDVLLLNKK